MNKIESITRYGKLSIFKFTNPINAKLFSQISELDSVLFVHSLALRTLTVHTTAPEEVRDKINIILQNENT